MTGRLGRAVGPLLRLPLLAVVLPAPWRFSGVSLRQWETSAEPLFCKQSREVATMAAEETRVVLHQAEAEGLERIQADLARPVPGPDALAARSGQIRTLQSKVLQRGRPMPLVTKDGVQLNRFVALLDRSARGG